MIAPATMDALADVARALGFELRRAEHAVPLGVDFDRAKEQSQFALVRSDSGGQIAFDGTARECAAFLIGWRDLRRRLLNELRALDAQVIPEMSACTECTARDREGRSCRGRAGHAGPHVTPVLWEGP